MDYALQNYEFTYFVTLSSKNIFFETLSDIKQFENFKSKITQAWKSKKFNSVLLYKYLNKKKYDTIYFSSSVIKNFLEEHKNIMTNLFQHRSCVEEFAFQTLVTNLGYNFYHIGIWCVRTFNSPPTNNGGRLVYKTHRK